MRAARRPGLRLALGALGPLAALCAPAPAEPPLRERVVIRRDTFGVPHVLAPDEEAAAFGLGFAMAEDHALDMGRRYLAARGESALHFGEEGIENDFAARRADSREGARRALGGLGRGFRRWLAGFAAGYSHFVTTRRAELPAWIPLADAADVLAHARSGSVASALRPPRELLEKYPAPPDAAPASPPGPAPEGEEGSNALALAGSRTTTGHAILLGNPHLRWSQLYWEAHVTVPGRLDFYGSTLVGLPVLRAGFNDRIGYVQTNNAPDLEDVYALLLDPERPGHYRFEGRPRPIRSRRVTVEVRAADGSVRPVTRELEETHLGPVVHRTADRVFAVRSMALESWRHFEGFYELAHARSLREFRRVLQRGFFATSNFTYADAEGNILYVWNARLPRRPAAGDYSLDVPGERRFLWTGVHPVADLPQVLNPPHGTVQNANNPPWFVSLRDGPDPARFPAYVERGPLDLRPQVALDALDGDRRFSPEDVRDLKFTTRMLLAERVLPDLLAAARRAEPKSPELASALSVLASWDRGVGAASRGALLFQEFWERLVEAKPQPFARAWDAARPAATPAGLADPGAALPILEAAVRTTRERHGSARAAWGDVHRYRLGDLDLPGDGAPGRYGVYRVMGYEAAPDGKLVAGRAAPEQPLAGGGDAWVLLVHFARPVKAWSVLAYGQTTKATSPHSHDQIALFARHELRPVWYRTDEIEAHLERAYRP